jgi:hypothetical protein
MSSDTKTPSIAPIDTAVGRALQTQYANLSRRSFLSSLTRQVFGLVGVSLAAEVLPYLAAPAQAEGWGDGWTDCGLHGYVCDGTTTCSGSGGSLGASWVQCCEKPLCPAFWKCCTYTDYCGTRPQNWGTGCYGNYIAGAPAWCGGASGSYLCTIYSCTPTEWLSLANCQAHCAGSSCAFP